MSSTEWPGAGAMEEWRWWDGGGVTGVAHRHVHAPLPASVLAGEKKKVFLGGLSCLCVSWSAPRLPPLPPPRAHAPTLALGPSHNLSSIPRAAAQRASRATCDAMQPAGRGVAVTRFLGELW
ncbi:hypothetical protein GUJ93_ZPchr0001g31396 [Zizania palustris]|uniref:Uncharacterized protein n=1 Tax=Zizania palustris TaxID=103762 RepID=A0A8J5VDH4_ZIZPA|nr:hypothetical protein GUJ93_ZPchr0001g31396 [Zizania palustris]